MTDITTTIRRARLIRADCDADSKAVDKTPFTPRGVGETFGQLLAMIAALAECVVELAEANEALANRIEGVTRMARAAGDRPSVAEVYE